MPRNVLVTGGAGYVGSVLVPRLLEAGHNVTVLDLYIYGEYNLQDHPNLTEIQGDVRDPDDVGAALQDCDTVIHLACISNDPCYELNPALSRSIDYDSFRPLIKAAKKEGVNRFIYASSSSVYGVKTEEEVTEDLPLEPLTDYSKSKVDCERVLTEEREPGFVTCILRPATVCGYSPRQRLDVVVNALASRALAEGRIFVDGGAQMRCNLHIKDMAEVYKLLLDLPDEAIDGKTWNVGGSNRTVKELAMMVSAIVKSETVVRPMVDPRSYRICSKRIKDDIGFMPSYCVPEAIMDLEENFSKLDDPMNNPLYYNIRRMKEIELT